MKPIAEFVHEDRGVMTVKVEFLPGSYKETEGLAYDIGEAAIKAWRESLREEAEPPTVGGRFEGKKILVAQEKGDELRVKLEDGTLIAFSSKKPYAELRRKVPESVGVVGKSGADAHRSDSGEAASPVLANAGPTRAKPEASAGAQVEPAPTDSGNYLFAAVENLTDLVGECFAECKSDEAKAMELLESLKDKHPVLKAANQKTWRDRAQRRMKVLALRDNFKE